MGLSSQRLPINSPGKKCTAQPKETRSIVKTNQSLILEQIWTAEKKDAPGKPFSPPWHIV
jgi:hypothetical protein